MTTRRSYKTMQAVFGEKARARKRAALSKGGWAVFQIKKDGGLYKEPHSRHDDESAAVAECERISKLNPALKFRVVGP